MSEHFERGGNHEGVTPSDLKIQLEGLKIFENEEAFQQFLETLQAFTSSLPGYEADDQDSDPYAFEANLATKVKATVKKAMVKSKRENLGMYRKLYTDTLGDAYDLFQDHPKQKDLAQHVAKDARKLWAVLRALETNEDDRPILEEAAKALRDILEMHFAERKKEQALHNVLAAIAVNTGKQMFKLLKNFAILGIEYLSVALSNGYRLAAVFAPGLFRKNFDSRSDPLRPLVLFLARELEALAKLMGLHKLPQVKKLVQKLGKYGLPWSWQIGDYFQEK